MLGNWGMNGIGMLAQTVITDLETLPTSSFAWNVFVAHLFSGLAFSVLGLAVFLCALWIIVKLAPIPILKEIEEDQNTALAIIIGSILVGMAIIISSAIQG